MPSDFYISGKKYKPFKIFLFISVMCFLLVLFIETSMDNTGSIINTYPQEGLSNDIIIKTVMYSDEKPKYFEAETIIDVSRIRVSGTLISKNIKTAIISIDHNEENLYRPYDFLIDEYIIVDIDKNNILIQKGTDIIKINSEAYVNSNEGDDAEVNVSSYFSPEDKLQKYINNRSLVSVEFPIGVKSAGIEKVNDYFYLLNRKLIEDQILNKNVLKHASLEFTDKNEAILTEVVPGSIFDAAGLLPGDKIVSVDNFPVNSIFDFMDIYKDSGQKNNVSVKIKRNGNAHKINYEYY